MKNLCLLLLLCLTACDAGENSQTAKNSPTSLNSPGRSTTSQFNGEVDGCRLYYVTPVYGQPFHLAVCGQRNTASWTERCGKNCSKVVSISTDRED